MLLIPVLVFLSCKQQAHTPAGKLHRAQEEAENAEKIKLPDFTFYPDFVEPQFGKEYIISPMVTAYIKIEKNRIGARLPYLGHFYIRPLSRMDVPVTFVSDKFIYLVSYDKEADKFDITISPQDVYNVIDQNMVVRMEMDKDGNGTVSIKTDGRDEIRYRGHYR